VQSRTSSPIKVVAEVEQKENVLSGVSHGLRSDLISLIYLTEAVAQKWKTPAEGPSDKAMAGLTEGAAQVAKRVGYQFDDLMEAAAVVSGAAVGRTVKTRVDEALRFASEATHGVTVTYEQCGLQCLMHRFVVTEALRRSIHAMRAGRHRADLHLRAAVSEGQLVLQVTPTTPCSDPAKFEEASASAISHIKQAAGSAGIETHVHALPEAWRTYFKVRVEPEEA